MVRPNNTDQSGPVFGPRRRALEDSSSIGQSCPSADPKHTAPPLAAAVVAFVFLLVLVAAALVLVAAAAAASVGREDTLR